MEEYEGYENFKGYINDIMQSEAYINENHPLHTEVIQALERCYNEPSIVNERNQNPDNYYIWRTQGDNNVRSSHAEREGKVFSFDDPPEGGHPGEDYGCRCIAEPYIPTNDELMILSNSIRLETEEKPIDFSYKDTKGLITTGIGKKVSNYNDFKALDWRDKNGNKATEEQIKNDFDNIKNAPKGNYVAEFYEKYTEIRLLPTEIYKLAKEHLENDLKYIRQHVKNFDELPKEIRDVIIDIKYNVGNITSFPKFLNALQKKDINTMIKESHRKDIPESRNDWAARTLRQVEWE